MIVKIGGKEIPITSEWMAFEKPLRDQPHTGIDLGFEHGSVLVSPVQGIVEKVVDFGSENIGKGIYITLEDGKTLILGHLSEIHVEKGESIGIGDVLAETGSSGHSTGAHLHVGLKDTNGQFINPENITDSLQGMYSSGVMPQEEGGGVFSAITNFGENLTNVKDFFATVKTDGFFQALTGMNGEEFFITWFFNTCTAFFEIIFKHNDLFFAIPAVILMFLTFMIGRNRTTRFILPAWFIYAITEWIWKVYYPTFNL